MTFEIATLAIITSDARARGFNVFIIGHSENINCIGQHSCDTPELGICISFDKAKQWGVLDIRVGVAEDVWKYF